MQAIAAEINFSETTFVAGAPDAEDAHRVAMFTPARRIDFAGHAILGTAWVIRRARDLEAQGSLRLLLDGGLVHVHFEDDDTTWFTAPPLQLGATCSPAMIAGAVGVSADDIDTRSTVQQVRAGATAALLVPLRSRDALSRCGLDLAKFATLAPRGFSPLVYLFCGEATRPESDVRARFFFDA